METSTEAGGESPVRLAALWPIPACAALIVLGWALLGLDMMRVGAPLRPGQFLDPMEWAAGFFAFTSSNHLDSAIDGLLLLFTFVALRNRPRGLAFGLVWTAAFLAPLTLSPGPMHRYYIPQAGYLTIYALGAAAAWEAASRLLPGLRRSGAPGDGPEGPCAESGT